MDNKALRTIALLAERYRDEILEEWMPRKNIFMEDWFEALDFFLSHVFYQGRRDELSTRYYEATKQALRVYFSEAPETRASRYEQAWGNKWIPHDPDWKAFVRDNNPLMFALAKAEAGKKRAQEMVLDTLRFIRELRKRNVVNFSHTRVAAGEIAKHYQELQGIWQVGPKTSSFYLRDLCSLYDLKVSDSVSVATQPVDTWVRTISSQLGIIDPKDDDTTARAKIVRVCKRARVSSSDFNAGAWYLGSNSLRIALEHLV